MTTEKIKVKAFHQKSMEINPANVREVADAYRQLNHVEKSAKDEQGKLKGILLESKVNEFFLEDKEKVQFQEGAINSELSTEILFKELSVEDFLSVATISETALKKLELPKEQIEVLIAKAKKITGKKSDSVKVASISAKELKEIRG